MANKLSFVRKVHSIVIAFEFLRTRTLYLQYTVLYNLLAWVDFSFAWTGAFFIPYFLCLITTGVPIVFLEIAIGQYFATGGISCWDISPIMRGEFSHPQHDSWLVNPFCCTLRLSWSGVPKAPMILTDPNNFSFQVWFWYRSCKELRGVITVSVYINDYTGIGYGTTLMAGWLNVYYIVVLAWGLLYLYYILAYASTGHLPWSTCDNAWYSSSSFSSLLLCCALTWIILGIPKDVQLISSQEPTRQSNLITALWTPPETRILLLATQPLRRTLTVPQLYRRSIQ